MSINRAIQITSVICFALLTAALFMARNTPATGYETSIYTSTPLPVWVFLIISIIAGISIIVHQIYVNRHEQNYLWMIGLLLIIVSYVTILALSVIRGYEGGTLGRGDAPTHLGIIQGVIQTGHIESFGPNVYPITHIFGAVLIEICSIGPESVPGYLPLYLGILFPLYMYLFARSVLPKKGQIILATIISLTFLQGWYLYLTPNHLSNLLFPLALFITIRVFITGTVSWRVLLVIMIFLYAPFHLVPCFVLLLTLLAIWLPDRILGTLRHDTSKAMSKAVTPNFNMAILSFTWSFVWIFIAGSFVLEASALNVKATIIEGAPTALQLLSDKILYAQSYGYSALEQFLKVYGAIAVLIILVVTALPILRREAPTEANLRVLVSLYGPLAAFTLFITGLYFVNLGFGPGRLVTYVVMMCTVLSGFMLYEIMQRVKHSHSIHLLSRLSCLLVMVLLFGLFMSGILTLYPSPYKLGINDQVTRSEIEGMRWFFDKKDTTIAISSNYVIPYRYADFLLASDYKQQRGDIFTERRRVFPPYHFNYDTRTMLGESYSEDIYMVLSKLDELVYVEVFPEIQQYRYYPSDYERLEQDRSVDKLYSNGGLNVWYIHHLAEPD